MAVWLWLRDRARRAVVVFYDVNDDVAAWFEQLVESFLPFVNAHRKRQHLVVGL